MNKELNQIEADEITERDNLAVIYAVERLEAIAGKDRVELVHLKDCGYTTICEKGHSVGDLVVFVKYDTVCPKIDLFGFLAETKFRIKPKCFTEKDEEGTVTKKIYSQGICLPLKEVIKYIKTTTAEEDGLLDKFYDKLEEDVVFWESSDLTQVLGIKKYIPPANGAGSSFGQMNSKGDFPTHLVSKTDETNLASKTVELKYIQGKRVYITIKVEGSSLTTLWDKENIEQMVCSRNNQIGYHETNKFWQVVNKYDFKTILEAEQDVVVQAECYGSGIQKNKLGIEGNDLAIFNVYKNGVMLTFDELVAWTAHYGVPMAQVLIVIDNFDWTFDDLQAFADIQTYSNGEKAEGIVVRSCEPVDRKGVMVNWSYKVINRDYKL